MSFSDWTPLALWLAVVASGILHGLNPGMGWPLALSAGLMESRPAALLRALAYLAAGHLAAILLVLAPFTLLLTLMAWRWQIQVGASLLVIAFGAALLVWRRHPRALARIKPTQLALWSLAIATAHGAGLMLLPIYLGLCRPGDPDPAHAAAGTLIGADATMAVGVSLVHAGAMVAAGGLMAGLAYGLLGAKLISRSWLNLETTWPASLLLIGMLSLAFNMTQSS